MSSIATAAKQLEDLTNQILDIAGFEKNKMPVEPEKFDLAELIDKTIEMYSAELKHIGGTGTTEFNRPLNILADRRLVHRILQNLISNSLKFTKAWYCTTAYSAGRGRTTKRYFTIKDNGPGITRRFHKDVFSGFFRVESGEAAV